ncbi:MAG: GDSL-type esterase/lipase family protein [Anaerolineae bacterium]|nr:GDSL-type esterase/lipase family protein [Anaerolineae bacterium]
MSRFTRALLICSLAINLVGALAAAWLFVAMGGMGWLMRFGQGQSYADTAHYRGRVSVFASGLICQTCDIFVGDSITEENEWGGVAAHWLNRGISGDRIAGVRQRLSEITRHQPRHIHLMVGINDLLHDGRDAAYLVAQYRAIVGQIQRESPKTRIIIASILPANPPIYRQTSSPRMSDGLNEQVRAANAELRTAAAALGVQYVDHAANLATPDGLLDPRFTYDGLHINGLGYVQILKSLHHLR